MHRAILGHLGIPVGGTDHLAGLHSAAGQDASGNLWPVIAAPVGVDPRRPTHFAPDDHRHILFQPTFPQVIHQRQQATLQAWKIVTELSEVVLVGQVAGLAAGVSVPPTKGDGHAPGPGLHQPTRCQEVLVVQRRPIIDSVK